MRMKRKTIAAIVCMIFALIIMAGAKTSDGNASQLADAIVFFLNIQAAAMLSALSIFEKADKD